MDDYEPPRERYYMKRMTWRFKLIFSFATVSETLTIGKRIRNRGRLRETCNVVQQTMRWEMDHKEKGKMLMG